MNTPRISASSYSNTAPLIWSFLYGSQHGKVEIILDNAPARSAELLAQGRVDAALVPVIAYQSIDGARLLPDVCVGAKERVRSVCLVTKGKDLENVRSVALDTSSRSSAALTKIVFREFIGKEPKWIDAAPNLDAMLDGADAALLIGDPALAISECGVRHAKGKGPDGSTYPSHSPLSDARVFDLAEVWRGYTGLGFVFAMWMTRGERSPVDFAAARDEGLRHVEEIISNYRSEIPLGREDMRRYLTENISFSVDDSMRAGMELYFRLAAGSGLIGESKPLVFSSY